MNLPSMRNWFPIAVVFSIIVIIIALVMGNIFHLGPLVVVVAVIVVLAIILVLYILSGLRIVAEFDRLVIFRFGRAVGPRGPGMVFVAPLIESGISVDIRERFQEVPHERCFTKENAQIEVDFLFYWKIMNPEWSQTRVQNLEEALEKMATGRLRDVIGGFQLDEILNQRERIDEAFKEKLEEASETWGVAVTRVEIREIKAPEDVLNSMHKQIAADREYRAMISIARGERERDILRAEGEAMALERLYRAAKEVDPKTLQLKYLEALTNLGKSDSTKYVFPLEFTQFIKPFLQGKGIDSSEPGSLAALSPEDFVELIKKTIMDLASQNKAKSGLRDSESGPSTTKK